MNKLAAVAFPVTIFLSWMMYVVTRTGNGPGLKWDMVPNNVSFTAAAVGVPYAIFVLITGLVLYFSQLRESPVGAMSVLGPAFVRLLIVFVLAVPIGSALGEYYAAVEERAFLKETAAFMATAKPQELYSRKRWWPASQQQLVAPAPTVQ